MTQIINDDQGNSITEFPNVGGKRTMPVVYLDTNGNPVLTIPVSIADTITATISGKVEVKDRATEVVVGNIDGITYIEKFGRNTAVASGVQETIWDGSTIYVWPTSASITHIVSTNGGDTMQIEVQGLDGNFVLVTQTITLTGTTQKLLATPLRRVFRAKVLGSVATLGIVKISNLGQAVVYAQITVGANQTNMALYTIPAGKTGYLKKWYASILRSSGVTAVAADVDIFRREFGGVFRSTQPVGIQNTGMGSWQYQFPYPLALPEKTDIAVRAIPTAAADISAGFTIELRDN